MNAKMRPKQKGGTQISSNTHTIRLKPHGGNENSSCSLPTEKKHEFYSREKRPREGERSGNQHEESTHG